MIRTKDLKKQKPAAKPKPVSLETKAVVEQLKTQLRVKDKELLKLQTERLTAEKLIESIKNDLKALPSVEVQPYPITSLNPDHEEDQILLFSDLHAGEVIRPEEIDGFNSYNFETMCCRLATLRDSVISIKDLHSHAFKIKRLYVFSLGDLVTGEIHNMAETNEFPVMATIQQTALVIAQFLLSLASRYEEVHYVGVAGNHDRRHDKPRTKNGDDNWSNMLNWCISLLCANQKNIFFKVPSSPFLIVNVMGWNWLVRHGHGKCISFAGVPFYGLSRKNSALQELYKKRGGFDYEALGHYHQQAQLKDDQVFINGSVIGANEFAVNDLAAFSPPSQKLIGISEKRGVTYTYKITLEGDKHDFVYDPDKVFEHQAMMADFISTHFDSKGR